MFLNATKKNKRTHIIALIKEIGIHFLVLVKVNKQFDCFKQ